MNFIGKGSNTIKFIKFIQIPDFAKGASMFLITIIKLIKLM